jgi:hypothetical protein
MGWFRIEMPAYFGNNLDILPGYLKHETVGLVLM